MNILITNLNLNLIETDLQRLFTPFGEVASALIVRDKNNNRSSGKGIIDMPVEKEGEKAIVSLNGTMVAGKKILVSRAAFF